MKKVLLGVLIAILVIGIGFGAVVFYLKTKPETVNNNKTAHIVFTSDKQYKDYLQVALKSAIVNKNPESIYDIHILCVDLDENEMNEFKQMETTNVTINPRKETLDSIKDLGNFEVANHVSRADLFKFYFPEIFKDFDKVLYIDSDTLIVKDLLELYNTDLKNNCLGAVLNYKAGYNWKKYLFGLYWKREAEYTYNCGVMLYNLAQMRKENIPQKLINAKNADETRILMTQSAFNDVLPEKKITKLSPVYNMIVRWRPVDFEACEFKKLYAPFLEEINSMEEVWKNTVIIHYAGKKKPWNVEDINFHDDWWQYAKMLNKTIKRLPPPEEE